MISGTVAGLKQLNGGTCRVTSTTGGSADGEDDRILLTLPLKY